MVLGNLLQMLNVDDPPTSAPLQLYVLRWLSIFQAVRTRLKDDNDKFGFRIVLI